MYRIAFIVSLVIISAHTALGLSGLGTEAEPWRIETLEDFNEFAADANYWAGYTHLETDVNLAGLTYTAAVIAPEGTQFTGVFDGNDHKITSLRVASMYSNMGFFGHNRGQIKNLGIEGASIFGEGSVGVLVGYNKRGGSVSNCYSTGEVMGYRHVGGLVGSNYDGGSISNCYSTCEVSGRDRVGGLSGVNSTWSIISNCSSSGNVIGEDNVGGLVGENSGWASVSRCYSTGTVSGLNAVGGLVGKDWNGSVSNCYCMGTVSGDNAVGGLVGDNSYSSNVSDCYSSVDVEGTGQFVGGLVGWNDNYSIVRNCFWDTNTQTHGVTESIGFNDGTVINVYSLTTVEMQTKSTFTSVGWDFIGESTDGKSETWQMPDGGGYPELSFFHIEIPAPLEGSGTVSDPYLISDSNELGMVNWYATDCCFKLTSDIDLSGINWSVPVVPLFNGFFDGNNHIISGMEISGDWRLGLFGFLGKGGKLRNIGLEGGSVSGAGDRIGGLVGENDEGSVSNCYSTGFVSGSGINVGGLVGMNYGNVLDCFTTGSVSGTGTYIGGLIGENGYGSVMNCYSTCDVSGESHVGGLVGRNYTGIVLDCYSTGKASGNGYVGGLVGNNSSVLSNCYCIGETSGNEYVGGLVGYNYSSLTNCYSLGDVNGLEDAGGLVGSNSGSIFNCFWDTETQSHGITESIGLNEGNVINVAGLSTAQMQTKSSFTDAGWDFIGERHNGTTETWQMPDGVGYPVLSSFHSDIPVPLTGSGTATDPYLISGANELGMVNWYPKDSCFKITSDIDMSEIKWSVSVIPVFNGYFEGDDHTLLNIQISGGSRLGLFGYLQEDGQIKNLGLEGGSVTGTGSANGGLVGYCRRGSIWNCYSTVDVMGYTGIGSLVGYFVFGNVSHCYSTGNVNGENGIGGLVGYGLYVDVLHCYSTGDVSGTGREVGGLVGQCRGTVSNCYSTGDVSGYSRVGGLAGYSQYGDVFNCYSTGDVSGDIDVGGLLGWNNYGSVLNCFWDTDTQTHGVVDSIGKNVGVNVKNVVGLPTAEMQTKSTFTDAGWDFVDIWDLTCEGMNYPRFIWQITLADFLCPHGVDFRDYSFFAGYWRDTNCGDANDCDGTDFDLSGTVDIGDFDIFCGYWLNGAGY